MRGLQCALIALAMCVLLGAPAARAHCDTLDGPLITEAKAAIEKGDVTPVLKWVNKEDEAEIREAFAQLMSLRGRTQDVELRAYLDTGFLERLVKVHGRLDGQVYGKLKPAGSITDPALLAAEAAMAGGNVDRLARYIADQAEQGIRQRFAAAVEARRQAAESVELGRKYIRAYMEFVHYVDRLHRDARSAAIPPEGAKGAEAAGHQH